MVRHGEIEAEQSDDGANQPFSLAQRQTEAASPGDELGGLRLRRRDVIQAPGGPTDDHTGGFVQLPVSDEMVGAAIGEFFSRPYDLLLGRRTHDIFAAYWPYVDGEGTMGKAFTAANKYVPTRREQPLPWANSYRMRGMNDVAMLKQGNGPDLLIQGSNTIYPALLAAGLLDRLVRSTFPILLGSGKRLFGEPIAAA